MTANMCLSDSVLFATNEISYYAFILQQFLVSY